jgi:hypothetical protein
MKTTKNTLPINDELPDLELHSLELDNFQLDDDEELKQGEIVTALNDEIKSIKNKNDTFKQEINCENYLILVFSTKEDKDEFSKNVGITEHTMVDGYQFAKSLQVEPQKPKFKMRAPMKVGDRKL